MNQGKLSLPFDVDTTSIRTRDLSFEHVTTPRRSWQEAGKERINRPTLERRHLQAGIGYSHEKGYNFSFCNKQGKWIIKWDIATADEALSLYNELSDFGRNVRVSQHRME